MIAIIDYGLGNLFSIFNMLYHIEQESIITGNPEEIKMADKLILPGVGTFDEGMDRLEQRKLKTVILKEVLDNKKPVLGICLGMQLLGRSSEEGKKKGLGLIDFDTVKFKIDSDSNLKVPHMGWEQVNFYKPECPLCKGIRDTQRYYFVHSYHAKCDDHANEIITCQYEYIFTAGVCKDNIFGVQFHPEKSHKYGMTLLNNFARYC